MTSSEILVEFHSWNEIYSGDELVWFANGRSSGWKTSFRSVKSDDEIYADCIEYPFEDYDSPDDSWSSKIYPTKGLYGKIIMGWKKVVKEMPYDPAQQGDTEDSI